MDVLMRLNKENQNDTIDSQETKDITGSKHDKKNHGRLPAGLQRFLKTLNPSWGAKRKRRQDGKIAVREGSRRDEIGFRKHILLLGIKIASL